ncbi:hypothetical protein NKH86_32685, partial [Mesorhizobium sp. M0913]|uniref:hypothetical protein n=2 Tax=Mesorhizobium TaxID=68287 RepID=UPI00333CA355
CSLRWPTQLIANDPERLSKTSVERNQITACSPLALFGVLFSRCPLVGRAITQLMIMPDYEASAADSLDTALAVLDEVLLSPEI